MPKQDIINLVSAFFMEISAKKLSYIILISLISVSCGLPSYGVAEPPVAVAQDTLKTFAGFSAPTDTTSILGYEIYYKIYLASDNNIELDRDKFDVDNSNYTYEFGNVKPGKLGFHRMSYGTLETPESSSIIFPLISETEISSSQTVVISKNSVLINSASAGYPLRVATTDDADKFLKPFENSISLNDPDRNGVSPGDTFSVSFVAFSYVSSIISTSQSSYPIFLGTITDIYN